MSHAHLGYPWANADRNQSLWIWLVQMKVVEITVKPEMGILWVMEPIIRKVVLFGSISVGDVPGVFVIGQILCFFDLRTEDKTVLIALKLVLKGMSLRGTADVLGVKLDTVRGWLQRAAEHTEEVNKILMKDLKVGKVELDELWTFIQKKNSSEHGARE